MAARQQGVTPPTPPSQPYLDRDRTSPPAGDDCFDPNPGFLFDDSYSSNMPSNTFGHGQYDTVNYQSSQVETSAIIQSRTSSTPHEHSASRAKQTMNKSGIGTYAGQSAPDVAKWNHGQHVGQTRAPSGQSAIAKQRDSSVTEQFGMITPPDATISENSEVKSPNLQSGENQKSSEKSEIARKAANKRHANEKSRKASFSTVDDGENEDDEKKEQYRVKNKIAAAKCRNKKRKYNDEIETKARESETRNKALKAELMDLRNIVILLKDQILKHSPQDCNCTKLHEYSMGQAARMLQNSQAQRFQDESMMMQYPSTMHPPQPSRHSSATTVSSPTLTGPAGHGRMWGSLSEHMAAVTMAGDMGMSNGDLSRRTSFAPQQFNAFQHYAAGDELGSAHSSAVSPVNMSGYVPSNDFGNPGMNGDMFQRNPFDESWDFVQ